MGIQIPARPPRLLRNAMLLGMMLSAQRNTTPVIGLAPHSRFGLAQPRIGKAYVGALGLRAIPTNHTGQSGNELEVPGQFQ